MDDQERPDYFLSRDASLGLIATLRAYYNKLDQSPKFWIEEALIPYGSGRMRTTYSVRSNISFKVPT